ncbi:hypothetical protein K438DRAFT_1770532 [Mycena galopus ATCC 62051]|nr:hypothetical protein K438DRAFT_1770532 [Mycena galopus ATCC 62051]
MADSADSDVIEISDRETPFSPHPSDEEQLWDTIAILKEKKGQYLVKWAGVDKQGKPWPDSWVHKRDCTDDLVQAWKRQKAQKKKETAQRKGGFSDVHSILQYTHSPQANKISRARNSTVPSSKASTSRTAASAGPSTRSLRSRTAVPDDHVKYESISSTPKKRRLSPEPAHDSDSSPPAPPRPVKKRRVLPGHYQNDMKVDKPKGSKVTTEASKAPQHSSRNRTVPPSDDEMMEEPIARPNGKGKSREHSTATPVKRPSDPPKKKTWHEQRGNEFETETPLAPDLAPRVPNGLFTLDRNNSLSQSNVLSPEGQARLKQFDYELAAPTQEYTQQTPLFFPASSEEPIIVPPHPRSDSRSPRSSPPAPRISTALSPAHRGSPDIGVSQYVRATPRPAPANGHSRHTSRHSSFRREDDSYRVGDVPETQSTPGVSPSPTASPSSSPKRTTLKGQMKPRTKTSSAVLPILPSLDGKPLPLFGPLPQITTEEFRASSRREEEEDELLREREGKGKGKQVDKGKNGKRDVKGKGRAVPEDADDEGDDTDLSQRVAARGAELADAARAERRAELAEYAERWKAKRTLDQIHHQSQQRVNAGDGDGEGEGVGVSMTTESDGPSMDNIVKYVDVRQLRQEEEENTQDVMAFYRQDEEREDAMNGPSTPDHGANRDMDRSEAGDSALSARNPSEDRATELDGGYDTDIAERSAWIQERASQQNMALEDTRISQQEQEQDDLLQDDSMEENLMYPPSEDEQSPEKEVSVPREREDEDEDGEIHSEPGEDEEGEIHSQEVQLHSSNGQNVPMSEPPVVPNGRLSKSRSTSAHPRKPTDDADIELPPTASTNHETSDPVQSVPVVEPVTGPRHLDAAMSLLNVKSEENIRLEGLLADGRAKLAAEQAKNFVLQVRVKTLEAQPAVITAAAATASTGNDGLAERLRAVEEQLAAERASKAAVEAERDAAREQAQQAASTSTDKGDDDCAERLQAAEELLTAERASKAVVEAERDAARREQAGAEQQRDLFQEYYLKASGFADETKRANTELEKRVKIAEEQTKEGLAVMRATFELRETALKSETRDWRNQANFLREQAIRTNDDGLRRKAAEHPELVAQCRELKVQKETLEERVEFSEEDLLVKQDEIDRLEHQLDESNEEIANLQAEMEGLKAHIANLEAEKRVTGDTEVYRCGWRGDGLPACPALFTTQEDLDLHGFMHVQQGPVDPLSQ